MRPVPIKAVFLDLDGTLVDSNEFHVMAWEEAFRDHGHVIPKERIQFQIGKGTDQLLPSLLPGINEKAAKAIGERHGAIFGARYLRTVKAFPGATDLVEALHAKGKKVLLASSAGKAEAQHYAALLKVEAMLAAKVTKDDVAQSKPAGDIFAAALAKVFPLAPGETMAVGDTPYDVEAALRCEVKTIGVRSGGFSAESLAEAGAPWIYASVKELLEKLDNSPLMA